MYVPCISTVLPSGYNFDYKHEYIAHGLVHGPGLITADGTHELYAEWMTAPTTAVKRGSIVVNQQEDAEWTETPTTAPTRGPERVTEHEVVAAKLWAYNSWLTAKWE